MSFKKEEEEITTKVLIICIAMIAIAMFALGYYIYLIFNGKACDNEYNWIDVEVREVDIIFNTSTDRYRCGYVWGKYDECYFKDKRLVDCEPGAIYNITINRYFNNVCEKALKSYYCD